MSPAVQDTAMWNYDRMQHMNKMLGSKGAWLRIREMYEIVITGNPET